MEPNKVESNNNECERKESNESCTSDQDVISLFYESDSMCGGNKSRESTTSIDEYLSSDNHFQALLNEGLSYADAIKQLVNNIRSLGQPADKYVDYIVRKILAPQNSNISDFVDVLKEILSYGYKFNATMINQLMDRCINNYEMHFHQFVLTDVLNKLTKTELDQLNTTILDKFAKRRLTHIKNHRLGLSHKYTKNCSKLG